MPGELKQLVYFSGLAALAVDAVAQRRQLEYRIRQSSAISEIAQNINTTLDPDVLLRLIILEVTKAMNCQAGDIWLRDEKRPHLVFQTSLGLSPGVRGRDLAGANTLQALNAGEPVQVPDTARAATLDANALRREGIVSLAVAPLKTKNKVIGVMHLFARRTRSFTREELLLLRTLANQAASAIENVRLFNETKRKAQELLGLFEVAQVISEISHLNTALAQIVERVGAILNVEKCWFMFPDESGKQLTAHSAAVGAVEEQLSSLRSPPDAGTVSAHVFKTSKPFYSNEAESEPAVQVEFKGIFKLRNVMAVPLRGREQTLGVFFAANKRDGGIFVGNDVRLFRTLASEATVVIQNAHLYEHLRRGFFSIVQVVSELVDARERYAQGHSERVSAYASRIAGQLGLAAEEAESVTVAGLLHDIGKSGIAEAILLKRGRLSNPEYRGLREHSVLGERILRKVEMPWNILPLIRHHHEWFNGSGYPDGLAGKAIPLGARILAVAEAFDTITTDRIYRKGRSYAEGFAELERGSGIQFDPEAVKAFREAWIEPTG